MLTTVAPNRNPVVRVADGNDELATTAPGTCLELARLSAPCYALTRAHVPADNRSANRTSRTSNGSHDREAHRAAPPAPRTRRTRPTSRRRRAHALGLALAVLHAGNRTCD